MKKRLIVIKIRTETDAKALTLAQEKCNASISFREIYPLQEEEMYQPICAIGVHDNG